MYRWLFKSAFFFLIPVSVFGQQGNFLRLNGVSDYVEIPHNAAFNISTITIECKLNLSEFPNADDVIGVVIKRTGQTDSDANWQLEMVNQHELRFSYFDGTDWQIFDTETQPINLLNHWYHVAATFNNGNVAILVDGITVANSSEFPPLNTSFTGQVQIGRGFQGYVNGQIDEVRIWNIERSESEIASAKNIELEGDESGLIAYYKMNESGSGENIAVSNSASTASDLNGLTIGNLTTPIFSDYNQYYVLGSPDISLNSSGWSLSDATLSSFRTVITDPNNFGFDGTVSTPISVQDLSSITPENLSTLNGFFEPYWYNEESSPYINNIITAFQNGMDLWLLEDDNSYGGIGNALGIVSSEGSGTPMKGTSLFFEGSFGIVDSAFSYGDFNKLDSTNIVSLGGIIGAKNSSGEITIAYWPKGTFSEGSGALVVFTDVDIISNAFNEPYFPTFQPNAKLAMNTMAWLVGENPTLPVELTSFSFSNGFLNWTTKTESNNFGWNVESRETETVNSPWSKIGFISGKGTTTSEQYYSFQDNHSLSVASRQYRLKQIDTDGNFSYSNVLTVNFQPTTNSLSQNYPNPFNPSTVISFQLKTQSEVSLKIYDLLGREIKTLMSGNVEAGSHSVQFNAADLPSGVYFYKLRAGNFSETKRMMLVK